MLEILRPFFEQQEGYSKPATVGNLTVAIIRSNMKVMVIEIKPYQLKNTLMELNHTWKKSLIISKNLIHQKFN